MRVTKNSHQSRERQAVEEHKAQDVAFVSVPLGRRAGDHDALGVDHLAHDAAATVGRRHQAGRYSYLLRGNFLQAAEEHIRRSIGTSQRHSQPAEQRSEEGIEHSGARESQAHGGIHA